MKSPFAIAALSVVAAAALVACGGGGGGGGTSPGAGTGGTAQAQSVAVQTFITDNLATDYSKVWVTIKKITAVDGSGTEVTLLDATASPAVVNLSSLASIGQFMATVTIPAGIYTEVRVTLDNSVRLVSLDGATTTSAKFSSTAGDFIWHVRNVSIDASASGQIVLDFNLAKFTYDAATGLVTPTVELPKPSDAFQKFVAQKAEVHGTVVSVDTTARTLKIDDARLGKGIVVTLAKDAVLIAEADGKVLALGDLKAGDRIEIKGTVTPGATSADPVTILATAIHVEPAASAPVLRASGEGKVTAVAGPLVTVSLDEASFLPGSDSVVVDVSTAKFAHGKATDIVVGARIEFRGTVSGTGASAQVMAAVVDLDGAPSQAERDRDPGAGFALLEGAVTAIAADGTFTVTLPHAEGPLAAGAYTVNAAGAVFREGRASCLAVGIKVEAAGTLSGTALAAKVLELSGAGCNGQPHAGPPPAPPSGGASAPSGGASAPSGGASSPTH